jgi:hypothetical protein
MTKLSRSKPHTEDDDYSWESAMNALRSNNLNSFEEKIKNAAKNSGIETGGLKEFLNSSDPEEGHTFLSILAIMDTDRGIVEDLVKLGADPDQSTGDNRTPLIEAISVGNTERALLLIELGADVNKDGLDASGKKTSPLIAAVSAARVDESLVDAILAENIRLNYRDEDGKTALDHAIDNYEKGISKKIRDKEEISNLRSIVDKRKKLIGDDIQHHFANQKKRTDFYTKQLLVFESMAEGRNVNLVEMHAIVACLIDVHKNIAVEAGINPPKLDEKEVEIIAELQAEAMLLKDPNEKKGLKRIIQLNNKHSIGIIPLIREIRDELKEKIVNIQAKAAKSKAALVSVMRGEARGRRKDELQSGDQRKSESELEERFDDQFQEALKQILNLAKEIKNQDTHIKNKISGLETNIDSVKKQLQQPDSKRPSLTNMSDQERAYRAIDKLEKLLNKAKEVNESDTAPLVWKSYCKGEVRRHLEKMAKEPIKSALNSLLQTPDVEISKRASKK